MHNIVVNHLSDLVYNTYVTHVINIQLLLCSSGWLGPISNRTLTYSNLWIPFGVHEKRIRIYGGGYCLFSTLVQGNSISSLVSAKVYVIFLWEYRN